MKSITVDKKEELIQKIVGLDFVFIALHGKFGEDGTVQSVLQTLDIPYSGCDVLSSAVCRGMATMCVKTHKETSFTKSQVFCIEL